MAKIERGRLDGLNGADTFSSVELMQWATQLELQVNDPKNTDDPRWLQRWADKLRRLAEKKEKAHAHKEHQKRDRRIPQSETAQFD